MYLNILFQALSMKNKAIRDKQLPHTCSRRGMARLTEDMVRKRVILLL